MRFCQYSSQVLSYSFAHCSADLFLQETLTYFVLRNWNLALLFSRTTTPSSSSSTLTYLILRNLNFAWIFSRTTWTISSYFLTFSPIVHVTYSFPSFLPVVKNIRQDNASLRLSFPCLINKYILQHSHIHLLILHQRIIPTSMMLNNHCQAYVAFNYPYIAQLHISYSNKMFHRDKTEP